MSLPIPDQTTALALATRTTPKLQGGSGPEQIRAQAEDFEAFFLSRMFAYMYEGVPTDGPFGGGSAEETYRGLLVEEFGKEAAKAGGIGLADAVEKELLRLQEGGA